MIPALLIALGAGILAALIGGMTSGLAIGREALGAEIAAGMGGLYGILSGAAAVFIGLLVLLLI